MRSKTLNYFLCEISYYRFTCAIFWLTTMKNRYVQVLNHRKSVKAETSRQILQKHAVRLEPVLLYSRTCLIRHRLIRQFA